MRLLDAFAPSRAYERMLRADRDALLAQLGRCEAQLAAAVDRVNEIADAMERAADLEAEANDRPVTRFDAREWAAALREIAGR